MNRREFIKTSAVAAASLAIPIQDSTWKPFDDALSLIKKHSDSDPNIPPMVADSIRNYRDIAYRHNPSQFLDRYHKGHKFVVSCPGPLGYVVSFQKSGVSAEIMGVDGRLRCWNWV